MEHQPRRPGFAERYAFVLQMKLTIPQAGLLLLVGVIATALVTTRLRSAGLPTTASSLSSPDEELRAIEAADKLVAFDTLDVGFRRQSSRHTPCAVAFSQTFSARRH
jgi:hypothetical protein